MNYWAAVPALAASVYQGLGFLAARPPHFTPGETPPISILKPVRGFDARFAEAIESHAEQDYPEYEILFGARDESDPAVPLIRALAARHPRVKLILCGGDAPNGKVGVLEELAAHARYPVLLVNDSDIRVKPDYLRQVAGALHAPEVGLATCLYRANGDSFAARMEALGIATDFIEGVLVARFLGQAGFALGSTMAFRRSDLEQIGGFAAVRDYLADDFQLGLRISGLGKRIALAAAVVETSLGAGSWQQVWKHQVRWARTIRASRPGGYLGMIATQSTVWALVALAFGAWPFALATMVIRFAAAFRTGWGVLRDPAVLRLWWLIPVRDVFGFAVWVAGLTGTTVEWRNETLILSRDGRIRKQR